MFLGCTALLTCISKMLSTISERKVFTSVLCDRNWWKSDGCEIDDDDDEPPTTVFKKNEIDTAVESSDDEEEVEVEEEEEVEVEVEEEEEEEEPEPEPEPEPAPKPVKKKVIKKKA